MTDRPSRPMESQDPVAIAEGLFWCEGSDSPTGRRVLDVRPGSRQLLSASEDPETARCVMGTPKNIANLTADLPTDATFASIDWTFDKAELGRIRAGFVPKTMEDKWRIITRNKGPELRVCFLRSWTNDLVFVVKIADGRALSLAHPKDLFQPAHTARAILDGYLLDRTCVVPAPRPLGADKLRLMSYGISLAGSRCDFVEPDTARTWFVSASDPDVRMVYDDPNAIDRQLPREFLDEAMGARFKFGLHSVFRATLAMLRHDRARALESGAIPTENAGLDHDELGLLRRWLDDLAFMDEGRLRRTASGLGLERDVPRDHGDTEEPASFFSKVPSSRWLVWGRGRLTNEHLRAVAMTGARDHVLSEVRREDPRFALGRDGWAVALMATGEEILGMVRGDDVVRGWTCTGTASDSRDEADNGPISPGVATQVGSGRASAWQLARPGVGVPTRRCYWVVESALLAGGYPESPDPGQRGGRIESLWRAGIRTFISLIEETERSPKDTELTPYTSAVAALSATWGERAKCLRLPIRDLSIPTVGAMRTILDVIDLSLEGNRSVYVHCLGGVGRTGTVIGCWLRRHNFASRDEVLSILARLRCADVERADRVAPETAAQRAMVLDWMECQHP